MLECEILIKDDIATVVVRKPIFGFAKYTTLEETCKRIEQMALPGVIFDVSRLKKVSHGMLGGLIEVLVRLERARAFRPFATALALCALPQKARERVISQGVDRVLPLFDTIESALDHPSFKSIALQGTRAIVLCAKQGARLAPLTSDTPVGMLDFLGRPILQRVMEHAGRFGIREFVMNPGFNNRSVSSFAQTQSAASVFCVNENSWQTAHSNDVATLVRLHCAHDAFLNDTFILQSNILSNLDLAAMMKFHRQQGADATISVVPNRWLSACDRPSAKAEERISAIILSPRAAETMAKSPSLQNEHLIIPALRSARLNVRSFTSDHEAASIKCGADYYGCQAETLAHGTFEVVPHGEEIAPKTWVSASARIDKKVDLEGPVYIGADAHLVRGSVFKGINVVGCRSKVQKNVVISNSLVMPETNVAANTFVDHIIASGQWAVNHKFANGSLQNRAPLEGVSDVRDQVTNRHQEAQQIVKIA
jgi:NDP-sugar pyrophosphorylase family protein